MLKICRDISFVCEHLYSVTTQKGWQPSNNKPSARYPVERKKNTNVVVKSYNIITHTRSSSISSGTTLAHMILSSRGHLQQKEIHEILR